MIYLVQNLNQIPTWAVTQGAERVTITPIKDSLLCEAHVTDSGVVVITATMVGADQNLITNHMVLIVKDAAESDLPSEVNLKIVKVVPSKMREVAEKKLAEDKKLADEKHAIDEKKAAIDKKAHDEKHAIDEKKAAADKKAHDEKQAIDEKKAAADKKAHGESDSGIKSPLK